MSPMFKAHQKPDQLETIPSIEVHSILGKKISGWAKSNGYKREKNVSTWYTSTHDENKFLTFWVQLDRYFDRFVGGRFVVVFQASDRPKMGTGHPQGRMWSFLDEPARHEVMILENEVIRTLPKPPKFMVKMYGNIADVYLKRFELLKEPYPWDTDDVWFRYTQMNHLEKWSDFIVDQLPFTIPRYLEWAKACQCDQRKYFHPQKF